jgi:hypothetical protein
MIKTSKSKINTKSTLMKKKTVLLIVLIIGALSLKGQNNTKISNLETLKLHTSGKEFISGENIWFKVYSLNDNHEKHSKPSSLAYVELISPSGYSVIQKKVFLNKGLGANFFNIPDTLSGGVYRLIAYTNRMRNFDYTNFFTKDILIHNPEKHTDLRKQKKQQGTSKKYAISLENNELVDGLKSIVYLKAVDINHNDSTVYNLLDTNGQTIDSRPVRKKITKITFTPEYGNKYIIKTANKDTLIKKELPEVKRSGINFNITSINKDVIKCRYQKKASSNTVKNQYKLKIEGNKKTFANFSEYNKQVTLPWNHLNRNYTKLILEDNTGKIVWSRMVYKSFSPKSSIKLEGLKEQYAPQSNIDLEIKPSENSLSTPAHLSLSIRKTQPGKKAKINNSKSKNLQEINNEILFNEVNSHKPNPKKVYQPEISRILIPGKVSSEKKSNLGNTPVTLSYVDSVTRINKVSTDKTGNFKFHVFPYKPKADLVISTSEKEVTNIELKNKFLNKYDFFTPGQKAYKQHNQKEFIKELYLTQRIRETYEINNVEQNKHNDIISSNNWVSYSFYGEPDETISFNNYVMLDSIREYFRELITWARLYKRKDNFSLKIINHEDDRPFQGKPAIFLDGVLYESIEPIIEIDPNLCEKIEIIRSPLLVKDRIYYGAFALYTKKSDLDDIKPPQNATRIKLPLYQREVTFSTKKDKTRYPDFRNTVYWDSDITLNQSKPVKIDTKAPLNEGSFKLEIMGITKEGKLIHKEKTFNITRK